MTLSSKYYRKHHINRKCKYLEKLVSIITQNKTYKSMFPERKNKIVKFIKNHKYAKQIFKQGIISKKKIGS